jgi:hypothetical protein
MEVWMKAFAGRRRRSMERTPVRIVYIEVGGGRTKRGIGGWYLLKFCWAEQSTRLRHLVPQYLAKVRRGKV